MGMGQVAMRVSGAMTMTGGDDGWDDGADDDGWVLGYDDRDRIR